MFLAVIVLCVIGLAAGTLLLRSVPVSPTSTPSGTHRLSIIIPARNEERNLPRLLASIQAAQSLVCEIIVVDDGSTDATAKVAADAGATVLQGAALPAGWTGKTWACAQGANAAQGDLLLFLDADTWFTQEGLSRMLAAWERESDHRTALSVLPYHVTVAAYEQLSLFFNLLMAFGAGGFGLLGRPKLFGPCLLISRELYQASGGHGAVRGRILENLAMAEHIEAADGRCVCLGGRETLDVRMFPEGLRQLSESWRKAFADGAEASGGPVLGVSVVWLSALCTVFLLLCFVSWPLRALALVLYIAGVFQVFSFSRQIGAFSLGAAVLYPIPLLFFFALFTASLLNRVLRRQVTWRGRRV
ncbi:glycosyltransferase family 2 protein [Occallatibacter savannae]|uniref:glycosyltransferase family 2 protein n=1 Tax=Occallatibacter savannae TaxID=1002691 RepID=UPI0013A52BED|nr:glycosyltransferase family 2 protein [Occallatibacter savannae]